MRVYTSAIILALLMSGCSCAKRNPAEPLTRPEIERAIRALWQVEWDAKRCVDADLSGSIEGRDVAICLRISCDDGSARLLAEQIAKSLSCDVLLFSTKNAAGDQFQCDNVRSKMQHWALANSDVAKCTHCCCATNKYVSWYSDEQRKRSEAYLLAADLDADTEIVKSLISTGIERNVGSVMPPRGTRIVRRGLGIKHGTDSDIGKTSKVD
jgi:hypothetical protein